LFRVQTENALVTSGQPAVVDLTDNALQWVH